MRKRRAQERSAQARLQGEYAGSAGKSAEANNHPASLTQPEDYATLRDKLYGLLQLGFVEKGSRSLKFVSGGTAFGIYKLSNHFPFWEIPIKLYALWQGVLGFFHMAISISAKAERQQLQDDLRNLGLDESFIERLSSLPFNEQGLKEAARLLQEKIDSKDLDLRSLADDLIKKHNLESMPTGYQLVQYFSNIIRERIFRKVYVEGTSESAAADNHPASLTQFENHETLRDKFYGLLRNGLRQKGSALHSVANGAMAYGIYKLTEMPVKLYAGVQGLYCLFHMAISIHSTVERQQFQNDLRKLGFDEIFIERLSSLPFDEQGLRETARLLQEKIGSEDLDLSSLVDDFIEKYRQEPKPMGYQVVEYFSGIITKKIQEAPNPA